MHAGRWESTKKSALPEICDILRLRSDPAVTPMLINISHLIYEIGSLYGNQGWKK